MESPGIVVERLGDEAHVLTGSLKAEGTSKKNATSGIGAWRVQEGDRLDQSRAAIPGCSLGCGRVVAEYGLGLEEFLETPDPELASVA